MRGRLTFRQHLHFHRNLSIGCCRFVHCWLRISHLQHFHCLEIQSYQIFGRKPNLQQRLVRQQLLHRYHLTKKFEIIMTLRSWKDRNSIHISRHFFTIVRIVTLFVARYSCISCSPLIFETSRNLDLSCEFSFSKISILFCSVNNCFWVSSSLPLVSRYFLYANSNACPMVKVISSA